MPRRDYRERGKKIKQRASSVAGTVKNKAQALAGTLNRRAKQTKERVAQAKRNRQARKELEEYRSDETTDQLEARKERARLEARREAMREERQEELDQIRGEEKERFRSDKKTNLERGADYLEKVTPAATPVADRAREFEPHQPYVPDQTQETADAGLAMLAGGGFGNPGDNAMLVGVDQDGDGQLQNDELSIFNPPPATGQGRDESRNQQQRGPRVPDAGPRDKPRVPGRRAEPKPVDAEFVFAGPGPDTAVFPDFDTPSEDNSAMSLMRNSPY